MMGGGGTNPCAEYSVATENPRSNSVRVALRSAGLCILGWRDAAGLPAHSDHSLIGVGLAGRGGTTSPLGPLVNWRWVGGVGLAGLPARSNTHPFELARAADVQNISESSSSPAYRYPGLSCTP